MSVYLYVNNNANVFQKAGPAAESVNLATFTKDRMQDHQHQMNWERGQIDYLGVDSFDNILRKIDTSISQKEPEVNIVPPVPRVEPRPPPSELDQTERQEMIVHGSPKKREVISKQEVEECKQRSPSKKSPPGFKPRPKPMRGRGQQDHRERYVHVSGRRNQQSVSGADLEKSASSPFTDS